MSKLLNKVWQNSLQFLCFLLYACFAVRIFRAIPQTGWKLNYDHRAQHNTAYARSPAEPQRLMCRMAAVVGGYDIHRPCRWRRLITPTIERREAKLLGRGKVFDPAEWRRVNKRKNNNSNNKTKTRDGWSVRLNVSKDQWSASEALWLLRPPKGRTSTAKARIGPRVNVNLRLWYRLHDGQGPLLQYPQSSR